MFPWLLGQSELDDRVSGCDAATDLDGCNSRTSDLDGYALMQGKMVAELKLAHINKGQAIRELYAVPPFVGRQPVFRLVY